MTIEKPVFWSITPKLDKKDTDLYQVWGKNVDYDLNFKTGNTSPLSEVYNSILEKVEKTDCDCLVLMHDDAWFLNDPMPKLERLFETFDLVGVAGPTKAELKQPALWHLMGGGFHFGNLRGKVWHWSEQHNQAFPTDFGPIPSRSVMIDGVFMAMNRKIIENMRFDQQNPANFHFYDLDFSLNCHMRGYKVGVGDVEIVHKSPGLREFTPEFRLGEGWFLGKYGQ